MPFFARDKGTGWLPALIGPWTVAAAMASPVSPTPTLSLAEAGYTDRVIVHWKTRANGIDVAQRTEALTRFARISGHSVSRVREAGNGATILSLPHKQSPADLARLAEQLRTHGDVAQVMPDRLFFPQATPPDPLFASQWHLGAANGINMPAAWDVTTGSANVIVAVVDTGKLPHNDLSGRFIGGYDFVSVPARQNDGTTCSTTPNDPNCRDADPTDPGDWVTLAESTTMGGPLFGCPVTDSRWHGTAMAGIIAASSNAQGIAGINWNSKILPVRVVGKCGGYESDIADGIRWAAGLAVAGVPNNTNVASVINVSLAAGGACSATLQSAIDAAVGANATVVVSAGNQSANASGYSPGNCNNVIAVGAVDRNGGKPAYTNFGTTLALSAPGGIDAADNAATNILTTHNTGLTTASSNNDTTKAVFGTSPAAAQVSGVVSLMISAYPGFTPALIKEVLQNTVRKFPTGTTSAMPNPSQADCTTATCGAGIVDAAAAVLAASKWIDAQPAIAHGGYMSVALTRFGRLIVWGQTQYAGFGPGPNYSFPVLGNSLSGIQRISHSNIHTLAMRADGTVWAFGDNTKGQIGDGTMTFRDAPVRLAGPLLGRKVIDIAAGSEHSLALTSDGILWSWGANFGGQLGDGTFLDRLTPVQVNGISGVIAIAAGGMRSVAIKSDGSVWHWGYGSNSAQQISAPGEQAISVAVGGDHVLYLLSNGDVRAFGSNSSGELGDGTFNSPVNPATVVSVVGLTGVTRIAAHRFQGTALKSDGTVWTWGINDQGQLGDGTTTTRSVPAPVASLTGVSGIGTGPGVNYAIKPDGSAWSWGTSTNSAIGNGSTIFDPDALVPVQILGVDAVGSLDLGVLDRANFAPQTDVPQMSLRTSNAIVISGISNGASISISGGSYSIGCTTTFTSAASTINNNQTVCVRQTSQSGCSAGSTVTLTVAGFPPKTFSVTTAFCDDIPDNFDFVTQASVPISMTTTSNTVTISGISVPITTSVTGGTYGIGCGTQSAANGTISNGQSVCLKQVAPATSNTVKTMSFTAGATTKTFSIITATDISFSTQPMLAINNIQSLALRSDGTVFGWGSLTNLGNGTSGRTTTVQLSTLSGIKAITTRNAHSLAVGPGGSVWSWGSNGFGQLGDDTFQDRSTPSLVGGALIGANIAKVSAGEDYSMALRFDGTVWAWGNNQFGTLGDGTNLTRKLPIQVPFISNIVSISAGRNASFAVRSDGAVFEWGGTNLSPVQVTGLTGIVDVSQGAEHVYFLAADGRVFSRGQNNYGQLGSGNQLPNTGIPQAVAGISNAVAVVAGGHHGLALLGDGTMVAWGRNDRRQIGDGTTTDRLTPVPVQGLSGVLTIAAGSLRSFAVKLDGSVWSWGDNFTGELGTGALDFTTQGVPATVLGLGGMGTLSLGVYGNTTFAPQTDVPTSSVRTSNPIVLSGIANGVMLSVSGGSYSLGCDGTFTSTPATVNNNAIVCVRQTASSSCGTTSTTSLSVTGLSTKTFNVTTAACDFTPANFSFAPVGNAVAGNQYTSDSVTITGISGAAPVMVSGGSYSVGCSGSFTSASATVVNGNTICVRAQASGVPGARTTATLTVGTISRGFDIFTSTSNVSLTTPQFSGGGNNSFALRSDGVVFSLGYGRMLGFPGGTTSSRPIQMPTISGIKKIGAARANASPVALTNVALLHSDGSLWTYGSNGSGQLGDGTTDDRLFPGAVGGALAAANVVDVAAGSGFFTALKSDGTVWSWGNNISGMLGDGTTTNRSLPVQIPGLSGITAICTSGFQSMARKADGTVWLWGVSTGAQTPSLVSGINNIAAIACGGTHLVFLKSDGTVLAMGGNSVGQIGDGTQQDRPTPVPVPGLSGVTRIAAGNRHSLALKSDGTVWAWGDNASGQVGNGDNLNVLLPTRALGLNSIIEIGAGLDFSTAIHSDGTAFAWGHNYDAQLGTGIPQLGTLADQFAILKVPTPVLGISGTDFLQLQLVDTFPNSFSFPPAFDVAPSTAVNAPPITVSGLGSGINAPINIAGGTYSVNGGPFTSAAGTVANGNMVIVRVVSASTASTTTVSTLTIGSTPGRTASFQVRTRRTSNDRVPVPQIAVGAQHSVLLSPDGTAFAVGYNGNGQLGNGTIFGTSAMRAVSGLSNISTIAVGANHALALRQDGTLAAWGFNGAGQLGHGIDNIRELNFVNVTTLNNLAAISAGEFHSLALKVDGTVWAWGLNTDGQCGTGSLSVTRYLVPQQVPGISTAIAIAAGGKHSLALLADGSVVAWGNNRSGQLGTGNFASSAMPIAVAGLGSSVISLSAGGSHSLAIKLDGTLAAWGDNAFGQLGDGTLINRNSPVAVSALGNRVARIAAGTNHTLALKSGGDLYAWGDNANSQLGDGTTTNRSTPFLVTSRPNMVAIGGGARHSGGINARGELFLWGDNYFGQVGNKSGNFNPNSTALNVLRGDSEISTGAPPAGSSTGTTSTSGSAVIEIALVATGYEFPAQTVGTPTVVSGKFKNQALTQDITGISVSVTGIGFSIASNACNSNLSAGSECDFSIQFQPGTAGDTYGELQVASSLEGSPERRSLFGTGVAVATPAIKVTATAGDAYVIFAPQDVGTTSAAASVTIANTGAAPLVISNIATASGGADFTAGTNCVTTISPGANCTVPVAFSPTLAANLTDELTITSNAGTAKVTLSGTGASDGTTPTISLLSVVSRKTHGTAGPLDIVIDRTKTIAQAHTVESRVVGTGHKLIFTFNSTLSSVGTISLLNASGQPLSSIGVNSSFSGSVLTLNLTNVPEAQRMTIQLSNLNGSGSASVAMGFLVGDVTSSRMVTAADIASTKVRSSQIANSANARFDINLSGDISSADVSTVKSRAGATIP